MSSWAPERSSRRRLGIMGRGAAPRGEASAGCPRCGRSGRTASTQVQVCVDLMARELMPT